MIPLNLSVEMPWNFLIAQNSADINFVQGPSCVLQEKNIIIPFFLFDVETKALITISIYRHMQQVNNLPPARNIILKTNKELLQ